MNIWNIPGGGTAALIIIVFAVILITAVARLNRRDLVRQEQIEKLSRTVSAIDDSYVSRAAMDRNFGGIGPTQDLLQTQCNALGERIERLEKRAVNQRAVHVALVEYLDVQATEPLPGPTLVYVKRTPEKAPRKNARRRK